MTDDFANEFPRAKTNWLRILLLVAVAGMLFAWILKGLQPRPVRAHPSVGQPVPRVEAQGWLNGPAPTEDDLAGKVVVFEAWAHWCRPCLNAAPHTVELFDKYKDRGVVFIGLTGESAADLPQSENFIQRAKFSWPCAYGVTNTLAYLYAIDYTPVPMMWVADRSGKIAWAGHPLALTEEMLDEWLK